MPKPSSIIPSPQPPCPQVPQWHPGVPNNPTISLKPASKRTSTGPRHGHPALRYSSAIPTCRTITQSLSNRPQTGPRPVLATASLSTSTSEPSRRGKAVIYHPFATATLPTDTPAPSPRAEQSHNLSQTGLKPALDRSSPRPPYPQVPQSHPGVAKPSSIIPSPRPPCPQVPQCHPGVPNNHIISLKPASKRTSTGPRHGHPAHKPLSAIPTCRTITQSLSNRPLTGPRPVLATATLPTNISVPSRRAEAVIYHPFATATLSTGTPVASRRAEQSHNLSQTGL